MARNADHRVREAFVRITPIQDALRLAARDAYIRHKQAGVPLVVWRNGRIVHVPPDEIVIPPEPATGRADGKRSKKRTTKQRTTRKRRKS